MKKKILQILLLLFFFAPANSEIKINPIYEGNVDAKIELIIYESLTCGHCASFHKNVYPELKKNFIDKGLIKIEFRSFPFDIAGLNAAKIAHCKNNSKSDILHFLFKNQNDQYAFLIAQECDIFNLQIKFNLARLSNHILLKNV